MLTTEALTEALERASSDQPFVPDYEKAFQRSTQLRVRHIGFSMAATIAAITSVVVAAVLLVGRDSDRSGFTVLPAPMATRPAAAATVLATLAGVSVTWLPAGFAAEPASNERTATGVSTATQDFAGHAGSSAAHRLSLKVIRGTGASPDNYLPGGGVTVVTLTHQGHPGQLVTITANGSPELPDNVYVLQWTETPGLVISVEGSLGASLSDVQHMAAGLNVQDVSSAVPVDSDEAQVRAAFAQAYTGGTSNATILGAIENGASLAPVLTEMERVNPKTVQTARVTISNVSFTDADHATVTVSLSYEFGGQNSTMMISQTAVRIDGKWKVTEASYCNVIQAAFVSCPAK